MSEVSTVPVSGEVAVTTKHDMSVFNQLSNPKRFLPYVRLFDSNTKEVKRNLVPQGIFGVTRNRKIIQLGIQFNCLLIAWRPKGLMLPGTNKNDKPISYFDPTTEDFKTALIQSTVPKSGYLAGPEFLLYIPDFGFATYFMSNVTSKNEAQNTVELCNKNITLESKLIEAKGYSWFGPITSICNLPLPGPDPVEKQSVLDNFLNPKSSETEEEGEDVPDATKRADR